MADDNIAEVKKKKSHHHSDTTSDTEICLDGCHWDSCLPSTHIGSCFNFGRGCFNFGDGCFDIGDSCTMLSLSPLRLLVILGLMIYGDWDFENKRAKTNNMHH